MLNLMKMTKTDIIYTIPFDPIAWKRPGGGKHGRYDTQAKLKQQYATLVKFIHGPDLIPLSGPLFLDCTFYVALPIKTKYKPGDYCPKRPDKDNYEKFLLDALTGVLYHDDAQIADGRIRKIYALKPSTQFKITPLPQSSLQTSLIY